MTGSHFQNSNEVKTVKLTVKEIEHICLVMMYSNYICETDKHKQMRQIYGKPANADMLDKLWNILYGEELNLTGEKQDD